MPTAFVDSDVIVSSLLSTKGASFFLFKRTKIKFFISSLSIKGLEIVTKRLDIEKSKFGTLVGKRLKTVVLKETKQKIEKKYQPYVFDQNDAHIIAGAVASKVNFLLSYN